MIQLSNRQRKAADSVRGVLLMIPWPDNEPAPDLADGEETGETARAKRLARELLEPGLGDAGLLIRSAGAKRVPANGGHPAATYLVVEITGHRWFHAVDRPAPILAWASTRAEPTNEGHAGPDWENDPRPLSEILKTWRPEMTRAQKAEALRIPVNTFNRMCDGRPADREDTIRRLMTMRDRVAFD